MSCVTIIILKPGAHTPRQEQGTAMVQHSEKKKTKDVEMVRKGIASGGSPLSEK